jgi:hypothetical protein
MGRGKDLKPRKSGDTSAYPTGKGSGTGSHTKAVAIVEPSAKEFLLQFIENIEKECAENLTEHYDKTTSKSNPFKYSPWELAQKGFFYLRSAINANQPLTLTGLSMSMGVNSSYLRSSRPDENGEYAFISQRLRGFIEMYNETALSVRQNPVGAIFVLKNIGWKDNMDINVRAVLPMTEEERENAKTRIKNFSE